MVQKSYFEPLQEHEFLILIKTLFLKKVFAHSPRRPSGEAGPGPLEDVETEPAAGPSPCVEKHCLEMTLHKLHSALHS